MRASTVMSIVCLAAFGAQAKGHGGGHHGGSTHVRTYVKKSGTIVKAHHKSAPDHSKLNNYSVKGNVNPYTGKPGFKIP